MDTSKKQYKIGDAGASGQEIATLLGQSDIASVYTTKDNHLRWEYHRNSGVVPNWLLPSLTIFDSLMSKIKQVMPETYKQDSYNELGKNLFSALNITEEEKLYDTFKSIKKDIYLKTTEPLRIRYILSSITSAACMVAIFVPLAITLKAYHTDALLLLVAPLFGCLGAILSVMQRSTTLDLDPLSSKLYVCIQGCIRAILGLLCGLFLFIVIKANLLLGTFNENSYVIAFFATVAGFSERLVPDLIKRFETLQPDSSKNSE